MKRSIALSILLAGISAMGNPRVEMPDAFRGSGLNPFTGKSGEGLLSAIVSESRPDWKVDISKLNNKVYDPFRRCYVDIFSGILPDDYVFGNIVPPIWWSNRAESEEVSADLHNLIPLTPEAKSAFSERRPGVVTDVSESFQTWSIGKGVIYGVETDLYSPPEDLRGRIARTYFYMAALYHSHMLSAEGCMMMKGDYPYLTSYAVDLLRKWHREQAPDEEEIAWTEYISGKQGGGNPFVTDPELVEYIWGDKSDEVYVIEGEPVPLHSTYNFEKDRVYLVSSEIPSDAEWTIDGVKAMSDSYAASELGLGDHHLAYISRSTGSSGKIMIKIVSK